MPTKEELEQRYKQEKAVQQLDGLDPRMQKVAIEVLYKMVRTLETQVKKLETQVKSLFDTLAADKVESLEDTVKAKTTKSDSTASKHEEKKAGSTETLSSGRSAGRPCGHRILWVAEEKRANKTRNKQVNARKN